MKYPFKALTMEPGNAVMAGVENRIPACQNLK